MNFRKVNNIAGWITGGIATLVYLISMEATASFWDCGEFASCGYKIEVGHSPGAPFFMLIQRIFGMLAGGDLKHVAIAINSWSAIASGLTILFLFWTITHLAKRLFTPSNEAPDGKQTALIIGAGLVGALAYTFSDTFWFSAVEAEVYATSSLFTALTFWAIMKWDDLADTPHADRWLLLIAYMIGLSVGVHLLNLLTIPALVMVYYFRKPNTIKQMIIAMIILLLLTVGLMAGMLGLIVGLIVLIAIIIYREKIFPTNSANKYVAPKVTLMGSIVAFILGCVILGAVQFGIIQGITIIASQFDVYFVNTLHLPFDSGSLFALALIVGALVLLITTSKKNGWYAVNTGVLCFIFIMFGFSTYIVPMIRSRADVPIDMTNPDNTLSLVSYVQREQFGDQPLVYGPDFDAQLVAIDTKGPKYAKGKTKEGKDFYEVVGKKPLYKFEDDKQRLFPRMWDNNDEGHKNFYRQFCGLGADDRPSGFDNMKYFVGYQMNWMWWRYFMWNYVGRQNDFEGQGEAKNGNWTSGIPKLDRALSLGNHDIGDPNKMSDGYVNNGARNQLYYLPFILGIMGLIFQFNRNRKDGAVVGVLFFFTGIAIGIYLNMTPLQPRERDYAFAGSTYAFAIWIGLGVLMVYDLFQKAVKGSVAVYGSIALCLVAVPVLMANQEWFDHNRSHKTLARAIAYNSLMSCDSNAVLFTFGDNETYPLWYLQEIEHIRPDVRIINTSLLGIDWYIDQLNYKINDADAVPMVWKRENYLGDRRNYLRYTTHADVPQVADLPAGRFFPLMDICKFMIGENKLQSQDGEEMNYYPTKNFSLPTPAKASLLALSAAKGLDSNSLDNNMEFTITKNLLQKDDIAELNIIAQVAAEGWKRPIYFSNLQEMDGFGTLQDFMRLEGTMYHLVPFRVKKPVAAQPPQQQQEQGSVDVDKSYSLFMNTYLWGGGERKDVYFDEKNRQMFIPFRLGASRIADELIDRGRNTDAIKMLDKVMAGITEQSYSYDFTALYMAQAYYHAGAKPQAGALTKKVVNNAHSDIKWMMSLSDENRDGMTNEANRDLSIIYQLEMEAQRSGDTQTAEWILTVLQQLGSETHNSQELNQRILQAIQELQRMKAGGAMPQG